MGQTKIIHTSDLHLGTTFKFLGEKSKLHRIDCQNTFSSIIDLALKEKVTALLIAGDLFDDPKPQKSLVKFVISEFERLNEKKIAVCISSGNHDPYEDGSVWCCNKFPSNVIIFTSAGLEPKEVGDLIVYGLAYTNNTKEPLRGFKADDSDKFLVGLIHGSTTDINWDEEPERGYRKIRKADINSCNLDYVALGHFHDTLEIKSRVRCFYSGCPEPLTFKNKLGCVLLVSHEGEETSVKLLQTGTRTFDALTLDCTSFETDGEIRKTLEQNKGENKVLKLELVGNPSLDLELNVELLEEEFSEKYFFLKIADNVHLPDNLAEDETIRGHFIRIIKKEIDKEKNPEKKKKLENALRIGVGHLDKRL
jgi:DNA repair exonuclease SbcCD nuclease subunit